MKLTSKTDLTELFKKYSIAPLKQLGQNFLVDENILQKIADCAEVGSEDDCLEIGPGAGTLTQVLCERAHKVIAVELDKGLTRVLRETLAAYSNIQIVHGDILKVDIEQLTGGFKDGFKVVANLPYYITSAVVMRLIGIERLKTMTLLVQKEVAQRMCAQPGKKEYGILSVATRYYSEPRMMMHVPPGCFYPKPSVESTVIRLDVREDLPAEEQTNAFFRLVKISFAQRRKTILNNLTAGYGRERAQSALHAAGLEQNLRAEQLSIQQFIELQKAIDS
ncbi:MAG: 16S rRNA (adenine(1518)-N(6)/adenine(1519)-N(6))-dimethyltransferase RsmA [Christensenellales bacterium]|jgi:16S rRNA (adenine1518-N6/adenine1519-N6)-dimethyltransferase